MQNYREELARHQMSFIQTPYGLIKPGKLSRDQRHYFYTSQSSEMEMSQLNRVNPHLVVHIGASEHDYARQSELFKFQRFYDPYLFEALQSDLEEEQPKSKSKTKTSKCAFRSGKHENKRKAKESKKSHEQIECKFDNMEIEEKRQIQAFNTFVLNNANCECCASYMQRAHYSNSKPSQNKEFNKRNRSSKYNLNSDSKSHSKKLHTDKFNSANCKISENLNIQNKNGAVKIKENCFDHFKEADFDKISITFNPSQFNSEYFKSFTEMTKSVSLNELSSNFFQNLNNLIKQKPTESSKTMIKINNEPIFPLKTTIEYLCQVYDGSSAVLKNIRESDACSKNCSVEILVPKVKY